MTPIGAPAKQFSDREGGRSLSVLSPNSQWKRERQERTEQKTQADTLSENQEAKFLLRIPLC